MSKTAQNVSAGKRNGSYPHAPRILAPAHLSATYALCTPCRSGAGISSAPLPLCAAHIVRRQRVALVVCLKIREKRRERRVCGQAAGRWASAASGATHVALWRQYLIAKISEQHQRKLALVTSGQRLNNMAKQPMAYREQCAGDNIFRWAEHGGVPVPSRMAPHIGVTLSALVVGSTRQTVLNK